MAPYNSEMIECLIVSAYIWWIFVKISTGFPYALASHHLILAVCYLKLNNARVGDDASN